MPTVASSFEAQIRDVERRWHETRAERETTKHQMALMAQGGSPDWRKMEQPSRLQTRLAGMGRADLAAKVADREDLDFNPLERIIEDSQLAGIEFFERGLVAARAVARVEIRSGAGTLSGYGSGVLVSPRLFLTNNHVLQTPEVAAASLAQFEYLISAAGAAREPLVYRMRPDLFFETSRELDFTLVALDPEDAAGNPLSSRGWCPFIAASGKALKGERVNIIQHPQGERMQVSVRENMIVATPENFLHYETDTLPGSSGSPVFNDRWELAAVHHAGVPRRDPTGRILLRDGNAWGGRSSKIDEIDWLANEGVRISSIVAEIRGRPLDGPRRALFDACFAPPRPLDLWDLFGGRGRPPTPPGGGLERGEGGGGGSRGPLGGPVIGDDGSASWLFRITVGPVAPGGDPARPAPPSPQPGSGPHVPVSPLPAMPATVAPSPRDAARAAAARLVERHRGEPYYVEAEDVAARKAFYEELDLAAAPRQLFGRLSDHLGARHATTLSYARARFDFLYPSVDLHPDGKLRNVYSGVVLEAEEAIADELARLAPYAGMEAADLDDLETLMLDEAFEAALESGEIFNCEHVVPQSWFSRDMPMKSDLHHLFTCEPRCNSFRGNIPFGEFPPFQEAVRPLCGQIDATRFEPEHGKGPAARATFYFIVRYPGLVGDASREMGPDRIATLLAWHAADPPGDYERHRNWLIEKAQGNRNPFIDHPELASEALLRVGMARR
ncbi:endonuclease [Salinarimonas sp.]|uniref:endonuclease n=1 Tax=Salinarimonas sp. TaxID=2766526 RepID=UPI0032D99B04